MWQAREDEDNRKQRLVVHEDRAGSAELAAAQRYFRLKNYELEGRAIEAQEIKEAQIQLRLGAYHWAGKEEQAVWKRLQLQMDCAAHSHGFYEERSYYTALGEEVMTKEWLESGTSTPELRNSCCGSPAQMHTEQHLAGGETAAGQADRHAALNEARARDDKWQCRELAEEFSQQLALQNHTKGSWPHTTAAIQQVNKNYEAMGRALERQEIHNVEHLPKPIGSIWASAENTLAWRHLQIKKDRAAHKLSHHEEACHYEAVGREAMEEALRE